MSKEPRFPALDTDAEVNFGSVMAHTPDVLGRFFDLYAQFWQYGSVGPTLKELTRLRNARVTDCGY